MLQLGGEIGEGVLLSAGCAPGTFKNASAISAEARKAGKKLKDVDVAGFVTASVADDPREAIEANKIFLAYIFAIRTMRKTSAWAAARWIKNNWRRPWPSAIGRRGKRFISDEVVFALTRWRHARRVPAPTRALYRLAA
jgi:alkanesulfonate monooxygenase SsuD/methylene tetrahydromethanopterin reductase-like flavin-dependent oxidoreductase (luciferase family)